MEFGEFHNGPEVFGRVQRRDGVAETPTSVMEFGGFHHGAPLSRAPPGCDGIRRSSFTRSGELTNWLLFYTTV